MAAAPVANGFASNPVFLGCEGKGHKGGGKEVGGRGMQRVKAAMANPETNVLDPEEVVGPRAGMTTVFAGAEKEKIRQ